MKFIPLPAIAVSNDLNFYVKDQKYAIISIVHKEDHPRPQVPENPNCLGVLNCVFADIDKLTEDYKLFSTEDAREILSFVESLKNEAEVIVVHCHAGWSRSPAVCAALSKIYNGVDQEFFDNYQPNRLVYRIMLETYYGPFYT